MSLVFTWYQRVKITMLTVKNCCERHVKQNNNLNKYYSNSLSHVSDWSSKGERRICTLIWKWQVHICEQILCVVIFLCTFITTCHLEVFVFMFNTNTVTNKVISNCIIQYWIFWYKYATLCYCKCLYQYFYYNNKLYWYVVSSPNDFICNEFVQLYQYLSLCHKMN